MMESINFRIAVKSFVVKDGRVLLLRRRSNDAHKPGQWDIPGGRLELGEDPLSGVLRETREETRLDVEVVLPVGVNHFMRDDGQKITMIIFLCKPLSDSITLSEEHTEYRWVDLRAPQSEFSEWLHSIVQSVVRFRLA